jgi:hypothetical protein
VAISNSRLVSLRDGQVTFSWKNYAQENRWQETTLPAVEFLARFLQHVLPPRLVRIRYYGLLAHCCRKKNLARCRELLAEAPVADPSPAEPPPAPPAAEPDSAPRCPACGVGRLVLVDRSPRVTRAQLLFQQPAPWDSS